jgi:hypothetical protein
VPLRRLPENGVHEAVASTGSGSTGILGRHGLRHLDRRRLRRDPFGRRVHHVQWGGGWGGGGAAASAHTVAVAEVPSDGIVRVSFDDGSVIAVLDSKEQYESYQVNLGGRLLIV